MIRVRDLRLTPDEDGEKRLKALTAKTLGIRPDELRSFRVLRRSVDARKKQNVLLIYTVDVETADDQRILRRVNDNRVSSVDAEPWRPPVPKTLPAKRPVIVGFGPAGMFAALVLAEAGAKPIVLERGGTVEERTVKVGRFFREGVLDTECNVQFGEGGAGTFSDGKLNTGITDGRLRWILERFTEFGAPESILYDALPHVGTDRLREVVRALRERVLSLGGEIYFHTRFTAFSSSNGRITGISAERTLVGGDGSETKQTLSFPCDALILAIGHSARDTVPMLVDSGISAEPKPFSMGVRIEQKQTDIDSAQYGPFAGHPALGPAPYKLNTTTPSGSAYTFCMCPGGVVVAAASEPNAVATNGMSYFARDGENANAALLVTLTPDMFPEKDVLSGMRWQRAIEQKCFTYGGGNYFAPAQLVGDFLDGRPSKKAGRVTPSYRPGVRFGDLGACLPKEITTVLREALPLLDRKLHGFASREAVLTAPETRSSSPVRFVRDRDSFESVSLAGLYPCGEGAGYAGGIISAAADGIRCAEKILLAGETDTGL